MIVAIADTRAILWYLYSDQRLGSAASAFIDKAVESGDHIGISAITIAEIVYLMEKGRIQAGALADLRATISDRASVLRHVAFDENVALKMAEVPRQEVPDLPDRIIAETALYYDVPALSRDNRIASSLVRTIW